MLCSRQKLMMSQTIKKYPGNPSLRDQREFFFELAFHFCADGGVTLLRAEPDDSAQK